MGKHETVKPLPSLIFSIILHGALFLALEAVTSHREPAPAEVTSPIVLGDPAVVQPVVKTPAGPAAVSASVPSVSALAVGTAPQTESPPSGTAALVLTPAATRSAYATRVLAALQERQTYPPLARARSEEGLVELTLTIARDGTIIQTQIARPSGSHTLDKAALELARALPPSILALPAEITEAPLRLSVPLRYRLR